MGGDHCFFINHSTQQIRRCDNGAWHKITAELRAAFAKYNWNIHQDIELFIECLDDYAYVRALILEKGYHCDYADWFIGDEV